MGTGVPRDRLTSVVTAVNAAGEPGQGAVEGTHAGCRGSGGREGSREKPGGVPACWGGCVLGVVSEEPRRQGSNSAGRLTRFWDARFTPGP